MFMVFVDLPKIFDTVSRSLLRSLLAKYSCPTKFLAVLRALHDGAEAMLHCSGGVSDSFPVSAGVRQGCVLAPVAFSIFMSLTKVACGAVSRNDRCKLNYRLYGSLFNLRRLKARTNISTTSIFDLQYADDAALVGTSREALQHSLTVIPNLLESWPSY